MIKTDLLVDTHLMSITMEDIDFKIKTTNVVPKRKKNEKALAKQVRSRKSMRYSKFVKHQETPVWIEVYEFPQFHSCNPVEIYDDDDWMPCGKCHDCGAKRFVMEPTGWDELSFELVKTR